MPILPLESIGSLPEMDAVRLVIYGLTGDAVRQEVCQWLDTHGQGVDSDVKLYFRAPRTPTDAYQCIVQWDRA